MAGAVAGYLVVSLAESFFHANVQHASVRTRRRLAGVAVLGRSVRHAHLSHAVVHHRLTFRRDHVTQFTDLDQRDSLADWILRRTRRTRIVRDDFGLSLAAEGVVAFLVPVGPIVAVSALLAGPSFLLGFSLPLALYPMASRRLHPYLHMSEADINRRVTPLMRRFLRTRAVRFVAAYHYLHHRDERHNFNLLIFGDLVLRRFRAPTAEDRAEMRRIGMLV